MFLLVINFILKVLFIVSSSFIVLIVVFLIALKLWLQPVKRICKSGVRLDGRTVLITGGNTGIGLETARDLAKRGARVIIACRDETKSQAAIAYIYKTTGNTDVHFMPLNLGEFKSIRQFADDFNKIYDRLDILVNNAGCAALKYKLTEDGIETVTQVNHFGPALLTNLLLDKLSKSVPSRIVVVSSIAYYFARLHIDELTNVKNIHSFTIYSNSKLCNILWTKALAKRLPEGVTVNVLHPGAVKTDIFKRLDPRARAVVYWILGLLFKTPEEGAQTSIYLAVAEEVSGVSGEYFNECVSTKLSGDAADDNLAEQVWEKTQQAISI